MNNLALSGTDGEVAGAPFLDSQQYARAIGQNSGNLVFQYAAHQVIGEPCKIIGRDLPYHMGLIRKNSRAVIVPSSNFIREGADFTNYVNFLERCDLPLVFLGLGAQASSYDQSAFDFHPSIYRFIDLIKERGGKVSVRGEFTAKLLERFGVTDVVVTGCPSNFINPSDNFAAQLTRRRTRPVESFITHLENPWEPNAGKAAMDRRLVSWTMQGRSIAIQQSVPPVLEYLRRNNSASGTQPPTEFEADLCHQMTGGSNLDAFRDFCAMKLRTYCSVQQWLEDSARFDFSVGMRLHGNMVAFQAGVPTLWVHHDARTRELVEAMALPGIALDDFLETCSSIEVAHAASEFDVADYLERRRELRSALDGVLASHGIALAH